MEIFELHVSGLILNKSFRTLSGQWLNVRCMLCDCVIMWSASSGRHRSRICHARLAARVSPNHFSQFIIRCLFHWLTCVAAGACAVAANWTARPQPRLRRYSSNTSERFSCIIISSALLPERVIQIPSTAANEEIWLHAREELPLTRFLSRGKHGERSLPSITANVMVPRVTPGTRACEAVTDWTPRVTRSMMAARHARLNSLVLVEHLDITQTPSLSSN